MPNTPRPDGGTNGDPVIQIDTASVSAVGDQFLQASHSLGDINTGIAQTIDGVSSQAASITISEGLTVLAGFIPTITPDFVALASIFLPLAETLSNFNYSSQLPRQHVQEWLKTFGQAEKAIADAFAKADASLAEALGGGDPPHTENF